MDIMDIKEFETFVLKRGCVNCGHQWFPRSNNNPQRCPRCQTWLDGPVDGKRAHREKQRMKSE